MGLASNQIYQISNEYDMAELLAHFDSNYIFDIIEDKLENINISNLLKEPNIVAAFEQNFKLMAENYPGESENIMGVRLQAYTDIINILCEKFNLQFNFEDDSINRYTAAFLLYNFTVCERNTIMVDFFVSFIINNKESLKQLLNYDDFRKGKDASSVYAKRTFDEQEFALICSNIPLIINYIMNLDISLMDIFSSTYSDPNTIAFLSNAFADKGNFFKTVYCIPMQQPEVLPVVIANIQLELQRLLGRTSKEYIQQLVSMEGQQ